MVVPRRGWILLAIVLLTLERQADALDPGKAITQYKHDVWTTERGLPQNDLNAIAQTPDGYLWVGTEEGLVRFDGIRFTLFARRNTPVFKDHNVQALFVDSQGTLWIGTRAGGAVRYKDGVFTPFGAAEGLTSDRVLTFTEAPAGTIWIGTNGGGLHRVANGQVQVFTRRDGLSDDRVVALAADGAGTVWAATIAGPIDRVVQGKVEANMVPQLGKSPTVAMAPSRDGGVWMGNGLGEFALVRGIGVSTYALPAGAAPMRIFSIVEDRDGSLWMGTNGSGLFRWSDGRPWSSPDSRRASSMRWRRMAAARCGSAPAIAASSP